MDILSPNSPDIPVSPKTADFCLALRHHMPVFRQALPKHEPGILSWTLPPFQSSYSCRHVEIRPVILSAAKDLFGRLARSFAALRMTARTPLTSAHGKPSLQMSKTALLSSTMGLQW